jgi:hypothetical protein
MLTGDVPDPLCSVAQDDLGEGAAPASVPGFQIQALAKLGGGFNGSGVGGGVRITNRIAFLIVCGLCENTPELGSPGVSGLPGYLALPTLGFGLHHRHAGAVHLDVEAGIGSAASMGKSSCMAVST